MTIDPKKIREIAHVCATLSKSAPTAEEHDVFANLALKWLTIALDRELNSQSWTLSMTTAMHHVSVAHRGLDRSETSADDYLERLSRAELRLPAPYLLFAPNGPAGTMLPARSASNR